MRWLLVIFSLLACPTVSWGIPVIPGDPASGVFESARSSNAPQDHLGSIRVLTDEDGGVTERTTWGPWGERLEGGELSRVGYTGHQTERESGLHYGVHRYLDPRNGRWTQRDPLGDIDGMNLYRYALNSPVVFFDRDGRAVQGPLIVALIIIAQLQRSEGKNTPVGTAGDVLGAFGLGAGVIKSLSGKISGLRACFGGAGGRTITGPIGSVTAAEIEAALVSGGPTLRLATKLDQVPQTGRALSVAIGENAAGLADTARKTGSLFTADVPLDVIRLLERTGLVRRIKVNMGGEVGVELRFTSEAAEFIVGLFK